MVNTDLVPVYRGMAENYTWVKGEEVHNFQQDVQRRSSSLFINWTKSEKKLKPFIIFKVVSLPKEENPRRGTVVY